MLETHGIPVVVKWLEMPIGSSVFVPGSDTRSLRKAAKKEATDIGCQVLIEEVAEMGISGIRIWRVG